MFFPQCVQITARVLTVYSRKYKLMDSGTIGYTVRVIQNIVLYIQGNSPKIKKATFHLRIGVGLYKENMTKHRKHVLRLVSRGKKSISALKFTL